MQRSLNRSWPTKTDHLKARQLPQSSALSGHTWKEAVSMKISQAIILLIQQQESKEEAGWLLLYSYWTVQIFSLKRIIQFKLFIVQIGKLRSRESDRDLLDTRLLPSRVISTTLTTVIKTEARSSPTKLECAALPPKQNSGGIHYSGGYSLLLGCSG